MESIRDTIERVVEGWQDKQQKGTGDIIREGLKQYLTRQEQRHIKYYSLKESRVTLGVDSSAWLYLLNLKKRQLLKNLNQFLQTKKSLTEIILQLDTNPKHKGKRQ
ncbi:MAG: hypothetical protein AMJ78_00385 [Omnitrophica WOR_2 bacterium SM23_29]|nr:MAG: hypothetical protein AMJ78_00385 [Omnitrophica WOR_2 bacterium SM23_29]